jgi:diacylglycerol kinase family enzyme
MRAAAIFGLGCSPNNLKPFQTDETPDESVDLRVGMPAASDQADIILLFGGDGTIHRHLGQLVKLGLPVLIVPAGSGNDFARVLGLRNVRDSLATWRRFRSGDSNVRAIDLGVITPVGFAGEAPAAHEHSRDTASRIRHYFCSVAGLGLDSEIARRANSLPRWLRANGGYAMSLAPALFRFVPRPMKISTQTENGDWTIRNDRRTFLAAFANSSTYGAGMKIAPRARLDDGQLDVCVIGGIHPFKLACMFPTVYFGHHLTIREVEYYQAARVLVETEAPLDVYADGEFVCRTPIEVTIQRQGLKVLTP